MKTQFLSLFHSFYLFLPLFLSGCMGVQEKPEIKSEVKKGDFSFSAERSSQLIKQQLEFGPRYLNSDGHQKVQEFLTKELRDLGAQVMVQEWTQKDDERSYQLKNIVARFSPSLKKRVLLGSHYDSKRFADKDTDEKMRTTPVPGANDSASGVAVLLELARTLSKKADQTKIGVDLVFFDGEEGFWNLSNKTWYPIGSSYFALNIKDVYPQEKPFLGIVLDMVCDKNLEIFQERQSLMFAGLYVEKLWSIGRSIDLQAFPNLVKYTINDDHTPLNEVGIPSMLLIDFDYPYWHTSGDIHSQCDEKSLQTVGQTLEQFLSKLEVPI